MADRWLRKDGTRTRQWGRGDRYVVRVWNTLDDRPMNRSFPDGRKTAAQSFLADFRSGVWERTERAARELRAQADAADKVPTLAAYSERWLTRQHDLKPSTRENYRRHLDHRILPELGAQRLSEITREHVDAWVASMLKQDGPSPNPGRRVPPPQPGEKVRPVARSTARVALSILAAIMSTAFDDGLIPRNVSQSVRLSGGSDDAPRDVLTPAETRALIDAAPDWLKPFVVLIAATGMRQQEAAGMVAGQLRPGIAPHIIVDRCQRRVNLNPFASVENGPSALVICPRSGSGCGPGRGS